MNREARRIITEGCFGLEKESLRVRKSDGRLAQTPHPFSGDPQISKDFCESQIEIITPVCNSVDELYETLKKLNRKVADKLEERGEFLWNDSNPPAVYSESEIKVARFRGDDAIKQAYRNHLKTKYGVWKMLLSGIHFNFSFSDAAMELIERETGLNRDEVYLKLAAASLQYSWLLTYLTAASPIIDPTYKGETENASSLRCSSAGYWNDFVPVLDYSDVPAYVDSIQAFVDDGRLYSAWELYLPVRLKPRGENSLENLKKGISHIELRMLDLNPLEKEGINQKDLQFLHYLLIYFLQKETGVFHVIGRQPASRKNRKKEGCFDASAQIAAVKNMQKAAGRDDSRIWIEQPHGVYLPIKDAALSFLEEMEAFYETWQDAQILQLIEFQKRKLLSDKERYANKLLHRKMPMLSA